MTNARASQIVDEALVTGSPNARASQIVDEALVTGSPNARASQIVDEALVVGSPHVRASQIVNEALVRGLPNLRASQIVIEALIYDLENPMLPLYPTLAGLTYNVKWSPEFFNMKTETTDSGADIDLALAPWPLHNFELTYSFLRNGFWNDPEVYGGTEFQTMMGFFLSISGTVGRFLFLNPDDNSVTGQAVATTDGTTSVFGPLMRTFGVASYNASEPVGVVNTDETFNVYLDDVLQDPTSYELLGGPCDQQIKFYSTPASGQALTVDMSYYYYCKFPTNANTFEKFMNTLWMFSKVPIHSCRVGA
jgi:hypothetical protein